MSDQETGINSDVGQDRSLQLARAIEERLGELEAGSGDGGQLDKIVQSLVEFLGADLGVLALAKPEGEGLAPASIVYPADPNKSEGAAHGLEKLIDLVGREEQARLVMDFRDWAAQAGSASETGLQCALAVPLSLAGEPAGVLAVASDPGVDVFGEADLQIAGLFARLAELDIQSRRWRETIERLTITDNLTGIWTRSQFFERAEQAFRQAVRYQRPLSAILIDIDRFKMFNEVHGYAVGDQVLGTVARNILSRLRDSDLLGRYGGEEFILLLPETDLEHARMAAERMRAQIASAPTDTPKGTFFVTISAGVASLQSAPIEQLPQLLDLAERAMLSAKLDGRNQVAVFRDDQVG